MAARWARPPRVRSGSTRTSCRAYDYWQYWRNTDDRDVGRFLRLFTDLPLDEIARLEALEGAEINEAKKMLATEATAMCRGAEAARRRRRNRAPDLRGGARASSADVRRRRRGLVIVDALTGLGFAPRRGKRGA